MRQGISPRRLALTLALGFTIGCVPVVGIPTLLCAALALALGLNLPAIQVANYAAMPFQLALIAPFLRLGARFSAFGMQPGIRHRNISPPARAADGRTPRRHGRSGHPGLGSGGRARRSVSNRRPHPGAAPHSRAGRLRSFRLVP